MKPSHCAMNCQHFKQYPEYLLQKSENKNKNYFSINQGFI